MFEIIKSDRVYMDRNLQDVTNKVYAIGDNIKTEVYKIAWLIAMVDARGMYANDGFETVHAWTAQAFGFKKTLSYNMLKIGNEYTREVISRKSKVTGYCSNLLPVPVEMDENGKPLPSEPAPIKDFSVSQLSAILPVGHREAEDLVREQVITPDMTVKQIKEIVKSRNAGSDSESESDDIPAIEATDPSPRNDAIMDNISTSDLIAELNRRGFIVYDGTGHEVKPH